MDFYGVIEFISFFMGTIMVLWSIKHLIMVIIERDREDKPLIDFDYLKVSSRRFFRKFFVKTS